VIELLTISYSPWSEKARWALDHHGVRYQEVEYVPMLGEFALRKRLGKWRGKISVPLLIKAEGTIEDSFEIAHYAEEIGSNPTLLFPEDAKKAIVAWNEQSEIALCAGRAMVTVRTMQDSTARAEAMPPLPSPISGLLKGPFTLFGAAYLRRKYQYSAAIESQNEALRNVLSNLQDTLKDGRPYVLGENFSYADVCMATSLQCVRPVTDEFIKLGPATRKAWTDEELADNFGDLLDWRDQLYESHRLA